MLFFLPSFFQKRILRYALARLELLDTEDLDLDNLEIAWGKKSSVELRNVGIHIKKLATLLQLPHGFTLVKARILLLRITVPADLYRSGILVEVEGVEIGLESREAKGGKTEQTPLHKAATPGRKTRKGVKADRPRDDRYHVHDPGDGGKSDESDGPPEHLPSTIDLAKSFLLAEPREKQIELQNVVAQSQHLSQSQASSVSEDATSGFGGGVSLPGFVADFLRGVGDRIQLSIKNATVDLGVEIDLPSAESAPDSSQHLEVITIQLSIEEIRLEGITANSYTVNPSVGQAGADLGESTEQTTRQGNHRCVTLKNIHGLLISDTSLFSGLSRFSVPPSPDLRQSALRKKPKNGSRDLTSPSRSPSSTIALGIKDHALPFDHSGQPATISRAPSLLNVEEQIHSPETRLSRAGSRSPDPGSELSGSISQDDDMNNSFYSNEGGVQDVDRHCASEQSVPGSFLDYASFIPHDQENENQRETSNTSAGKMPEEPHPNQLLSSPASDGGLHSGETSPQMENLAESKLFSHEEAESMYMSAMSQASARSEHRQAAMPGDWGDSDSDIDQSRSGSTIPKRGNAYAAQHDDQSKAERSGVEASPLHTNVDPAMKSQYVAGPMDTPEAASPAAQSPSDHLANPGIGSDRSRKPVSSTTSQADSDTEFRVVKKILAVDSIVLEIPNNKDSEIVQTASSPLSDPANPTNADSMQDNNEPASSGLSQPNLQSSTLERYPWTNIKVEHVMVLGDIGLTKLTILVAQHLTRSFSSQPTINHTAAKKSPKSSRTAIRIKRISWNFLDLVRGLDVSGAGGLSNSFGLADSSSNAEVLLKATVIKLKILLEDDVKSSTTTVSMKKLRFGYAHDEIMSFDSGLRMRDSTRDILAPVDQDLILKVTKSQHGKHVELSTLPLHVRLDLRRLDETFSWFGGFSSILGLGSSVISTVTTVDNRQGNTKRRKPARGVHFEPDVRHVHKPERTKQTQDKVTIRIGGVVFDLDGSSSSFRFDGTAVKVVSREEGMGLVIDRFNVVGPSAATNPDRASITAKIVGLRMEYLPTPNTKDLERLLALLSPSKDKYKADDDDDILLETLLRQRRQGGVLRITAEKLNGLVSDIEDLHHLPTLGEEMTKLSTVAKYLPEDDRPGIMTLILIRELQAQATVNKAFGQFNLSAEHSEIAHITIPSLTALGVRKLKLDRNFTEELVGETVNTLPGQECPPTIMARFIGNEMEPTVKIKLWNLRVEYRVPMIAAILGNQDDTIEVGIADMVSSIATLTEERHRNKSPPASTARSSDRSDKSPGNSKSLRIDVALHDVTLGLNPRESSARGLLVLSESHVVCNLPKDQEASALIELNKASLLAVDNHETLSAIQRDTRRTSLGGQKSLSEQLLSMGYVSLVSISAARLTFDAVRSALTTGTTIECEFRDMLLVIESCADSTQTLQTILNGLQPPQPPCTELKYRTEIVPVEDMLASFSGDAFPTFTHSDDDVPLELDEGDMVDEDVPQNLEFVSSFYDPTSEALDESIADSMLEGDLESLTTPPAARDIGGKPLLNSFQEQYQVAPDETALDFNENHFGGQSTVGGTAHRWDIKKNTYELTNEAKIRASPLKLRVRDVHVIWNLFDGYDWQRTRDTIGQAVAAVEDRAMEQRSRRDRRRSLEMIEEEPVIEDFLFNSIYIGIPANRDPKELGRQISRNIDDLASETESFATSAASDSPSRHSRPARSKSKVRLKRSKYHKLTFELKGLSADIIVFPPGSAESQCSIDVRVQDLEIFDHVPTSTWKKFATYMHDAGERESETSMIHLEILNVKPVPDLAASELILKVGSHPRH